MDGEMDLKLTEEVCDQDPDFQLGASPQGWAPGDRTVLILFSIFINGMDSGTQCCANRFADGTKQEQGLMHLWGGLPSTGTLVGWRDGRQEPQGAQHGTSLHGGRNAGREEPGCPGEQKVDCEAAMCLCSKDGQLHLGLC